MNPKTIFNAFPEDDDLYAREERCMKAIATVRRAVLMRIFITAVLLWAVFSSQLQPVAVALIVLVLVINSVGAMPLVAEWKKQRRLLKELIAQEEE